ncbi:argininosuccinate lyase [Enterococcus florum]|uniref:Argininosuccinate lyase n=1 Tax=Enterococcus florum TaxID=2480627 RepID=A0A4V0WP49_9ENTE|nr:argininosuccinate lyase [Enterococcus florum]GCF92619.1 argininosuccinate lyase [Enterococcus florum]
MKLWGGRFNKEEDLLMKTFDNSLPLGKRYYEEDIIGSIAHAQMLGEAGILTTQESRKIVSGLESILKELQSGELVIDEEAFEDIHSFTELTLTQRIGELGKKLHTARSRNDQVAVDTKLYCRKRGLHFIELLEQLIAALQEKGAANPVLMPGYTHLQRAQVVTFQYHLGAYVEMFKRDRARVENALAIMDENPLGAGALAGTTHPIDREITTDYLHFRTPSANFMDAVSDRDYIIELLSACSLIAVHLSRLSEELILWCSQEFKFITIDDAYATGSSMMPQKKNPDAAELVRGHAGLAIGSLVSMLTIMKGLPLTYNKDMQLDKEAFISAFDRTDQTLTIMQRMLVTLKVHPEKMQQAMKDGFLNATDLADYLVKKGVAFRDAHDIVGCIVLYCEEKQCSIEELSLETFQQYSEHIDEDIFEYLEYESSLNQGNKREIRGGS